MTMKIPLTQGKFALIDDEDYDLVISYSWHTQKDINNFYAVTTTTRVQGKRTTIYMHRLIMNARSGLQVDHINHNGLDNRRENLRLCTRTENCRNRRKYIRGSSIYKGVSWYTHYKKWRARIECEGKQLHLGWFSDEVEAAEVYDKAALKLFGEFAHLNFNVNEKCNV